MKRDFCACVLGGSDDTHAPVQCEDRLSLQTLGWSAVTSLKGQGT